MSAFEKIIVPASVEEEVSRQREGDFFADRTLGVMIRLDKLDVDSLARYMRLEMEETTEYKEDILRIATASFIYDRRFNLTPECDEVQRQLILASWIETLGPTLVAKFKGIVVGFLNLKPVDAVTQEVFLAAVDEKYRLTGAAIGLYAKAIALSKERGAKQLTGRISSRNMAVMNVYATFGALFSEPQDIFLKRVTL